MCAKWSTVQPWCLWCSQLCLCSHCVCKVKNIKIKLHRGWVSPNGLITDCQAALHTQNDRDTHTHTAATHTHIIISNVNTHSNQILYFKIASIHFHLFMHEGWFAVRDASHSVSLWPWLVSQGVTDSEFPRVLFNYHVCVNGDKQNTHTERHVYT